MRAILTAAVAWLVPAYAYACDYDDPCSQVSPRPDVFTALTSTVASDGVLPLGIGESSEDGWQPVVTMVDELGLAVPGRFVRYPDFGVLAWRPDEPFREGRAYRATLTIDVDEEEADYATSCGDHSQDFDIEITAATGASRPKYVVEDEYVVEPIEGLRALVCCDDAHPHISQPNPAGYGCPTPATLEHGNGFCTPAHGEGMRRIKYALSKDDLERRFAVRLVSDENVLLGGSSVVSTTITEPTCFRFEVLDLASGEISATEQCHDEVVGEPFGLVELDVMPLIEANCESEPFVCQTNSESWNRDLCSTYVPPTVHGCTLGSTLDGTVGWLAMWLLLLAITPRRACGSR